LLVASVMADETKNAVAISLNHSQFDTSRTSFRRHGRTAMCREYLGALC